jgi:CRP-like cAMP-binding protein
VSDFQQNQVLARLPVAAREAIEASARREQLTAWQPLYAEQEQITRVYFPIDSVISIVTATEDGRIAESYTAGRDGMFGSEIVWGDDRQIFRSMCQIPGSAYSMDAGAFGALAQRDPDVLAVVYRYAHCLMSLTGRSGACNLLHEVVQRCARWLLISQDRVGKDVFDLTQDILATMLGVRRPSVTIAAGALQKAGLISYTRGRITITDRAGLEEASCECYRVVAEEFVRVLGGPEPVVSA